MSHASSPEASGRGAPGAMAREVEGDEFAAEGDEQAALSCWQDALEIFAESAMHAAAARVAVKMAVAAENSGEAEQACSHYARAAELYKMAGEASRVPMCLNNQAMLCKMCGNLDEAVVLLSRALEEASHCHGGVHVETALIATNLGAVLCECGDLLGAEQRHMQALAIREHLFGATHPEVGLSLGHLAVIHQMNGESSRARSFYASALAILDEFPELHEAERTILRENLAGL